MKKLETVSSPYNRVEVWQNNAGRIDFEVSGATHATWHPTQVLTGHAWDAITAAAVSSRNPVRSILLLGLGGGTCLRQLRVLLPEAEMTAVEIDPHMIQLARTYMEVDDLGVTIVEADAFSFLKTSGIRSDIVIDDLYHARGLDVERPKTVTASYLRKHIRHLHPGGCVVMNFVVGSGHDDIFQQACRSFRSVFSVTRRILPPLSHNEVLVGTSDGKGLLGPGALREKAAQFPGEPDRELWKDLQSLKLRS